jgi:hypothetical protein
MRVLLTLMAMAVFAVSIGCDAPAETPPAETPPAAGGDGDSSAVGTPDTEGTQMVSLKLPGMT